MKFFKCQAGLYDSKNTSVSIQKIGSKWQVINFNSAMNHTFPKIVAEFDTLKDALKSVGGKVVRKG